jgi:hypothetical protein
MKLPITVTPRNGEPTVITTSPWSVMIWERKYKTKISAAIEVGLGLEDLGYLAFVSAKQCGVDVPTSFDEWMQSLENLSAGDDQANPTEGAVSAG